VTDVKEVDGVDVDGNLIKILHVLWKTPEGNSHGGTFIVGVFIPNDVQKFLDNSKAK